MDKEKHVCCQSHCCVHHGCKYEYDDCPVVLGEVQQDHPCETCDYARQEKQAHAGQVVMDRVELLRILNDNKHMLAQVKELQGALTLKEEQLRAHRRVQLTDEQKATLVSDLEATIKRVRDGYNLPTAEGLSERLKRDLEIKAASILDDVDLK